MRLRPVLLFLLAALIGSAAGSSQTAVPTEKQLLAALPEDERKWLEFFVAPIILPAERKEFLALTQPYEREAFKEAFWKRREKDTMPSPMGPGYKRRYEELRELAETTYDRWPNDAAAMVLRYGEPASINHIEFCDAMSGGILRDGFEIWTYGSRGSYFFYRRTPQEPRRYWTVGTPVDDVFEPNTPDGCKRSGGFSCFAGNCKGTGSFCLTDGCAIYQAWEQIRARQGSSAGGQIERARLTQEPAEVSLEGVDSIRRGSAYASNPNAKPIGVEGPSSAAPAAPPTTTPVAAPPVTPMPAPVAAAPAPATAAPAPPTTAAVPPTPAVVNAGKPLSEKQQIAALPVDDRKWLDFVAPIILPEEKKVYLSLTQTYEREAFREQFWQRREQQNLPSPMGPGYRQRYEELRQVADSQYDGWPHDAALMVMRFGEPASINTLDDCREMGSNETFRGLEIWTYPNTGGLGTGRHYFFYRRSPQDSRRLWTIGTPDSEIFLPRACYTSFEMLALACDPRTAKTCTCTSACEVYRTWTEIRSRQGSQAGAMTELAQISQPQGVSLEGVDGIRAKSANTSDPNAKKIGVEGPSSGGPTPTPGAAVGQQASGKAAAPSGPAPTRRKLSKKEVAELTEHEPPKYREFLELVDVIITDDERQVFLQIGADYEKDKFIEAFWKRRSINPQGLRTDFKSVYMQRYQMALESFHNTNGERAKMVLLNGPPDSILPIDCQDVFVPLQIWYYERLEVLKSKAYLIFYRQQGGLGEYRLWLPLDGIGTLEGQGAFRTPGERQIDVTHCPMWREVTQAMNYSAAVLGSGAMSMAGASTLFQPPIVETEGVDQILNMTTDVSANAANLDVTKLIRFPDERANRIGVDLSLLLPRADLKSRQLGEEVFYNVDIIGEVIKDDRLIDNFKYRFDVPTNEVSGDRIPVTVRRYLYPGDYKLVIKVSDGNQSAEGRITESLHVPERPDAPPPTVETAARTDGRTSVDKTKQDATLLPSAISIIPIAREIATGLQRFETRTAEGIIAVDFYLNNSKVMTKTRSPFDADLNLGPIPRRQIIRAVAFGPNGKSVGEDEYIVNEGRDVFRVRILAPGKGTKASGPTPVLAAVAVPEGKALQKVEFYSNETRVATLYQSPWEQTINIKDSKSLGYVRVVGTLEDGTVAEDVRYVNAPSYISEISVDAVELYTTVTDKSGRPVAGLQASSFKVFEDGAVQKVESFEYVKNVPLSLGVLVDTSASMLESLPEAQQAALAFLDYSIGPKDRAFTISFDTEPYVLSKLTSRKDKLARSLAGLRAEGSTSLYDAIVYGLYQFTGVKGKKALVILSDGKDTSSKFDFDTLLDYVKKSGIAIYAVGLKIPTAELEVKFKLNKLAQVTGGQTFMIDSVKNLESVYRQINDELRSQYLLTYYSTNPETKDRWRKVEVKVEPSNLQARTLSGYYP